MATARKTGTTIVDIARKLGISAMTVSRALNGSSEVSEETRKKVMRCAEELRYRPHPWARSLVTRKSSVLGIVVPDIAHSYFAEITRGVQEVVELAGYSLLLCHSALDPRKEESEIDTLVGSRVAGLIVASEQPERSPAIFVRLQEMSVPFVLIDRFFPRHDFPCVHVDDVAVGRLATEHLIELGHRRIAHIRGPELTPGSLRYRGYTEAMTKAMLRPGKDYAPAGRFDIESGREAMQELLNRKDRPTAVFAANDPMAVGAVRACREAGVAVPADMSIVGAGNIEGTHHPNPFLTTIDWPRVELGRNAATLLLSAIERPDLKKEKAQVLTPVLLDRQSTARAGAQPGRAASQ